MRLLHVELTEFRCFEHFELDLHPECNILVGVNAAGKTAVLDALALALSTWLRAINAHKAERRWTESDARVTRRVTNGVLTLERAIDTSISARAILSGGSEFSWTTLRDAYSETSYQVAERAQQLRLPADETTMRDRPVLVAYGTDRLFRKKKDSRWSSYSNDGYQYAMTSAASPSVLASWMGHRESVRLQELSRALENNLPLVPPRDPFLDAVANAAVTCIEGAQRLYYSFSEEELRVDFKDGRTLPFHLLSDGSRNLIALAGDIAARATQLNPHHGADAALKATGIVLIDEIDLHLHPAWQRQVVPNLRRAFPEIQFVVTTHSPQVISTSNPEWIKILRSGGTVEPVSHTLGRDSNSLLEDVFGVAERPDDTRHELHALFDALERGDIDDAESRWSTLRDRLGPHDSDLVRARTMLDLEKMPLATREDE